MRIQTGILADDTTQGKNGMAEVAQDIEAVDSRCQWLPTFCEINQCTFSSNDLLATFKCVVELRSMCKKIAFWTYYKFCQ